jgi:hypothetical protein
VKVTKKLLTVTFEFRDEKEMESWIQKFTELFNEQKDKYESIVESIKNIIKEIN